ncbi:zinc-binding dehydrogenase [Actinoplanes sp. NPDC051513]
MPLARVYALDEIAEAHAGLEANRAAGKLVVSMLTPHLNGR